MYASQDPLMSRRVGWNTGTSWHFTTIYSGALDLLHTKASTFRSEDFCKIFRQCVDPSSQQNTALREVLLLICVILSAQNHCMFRASERINSFSILPIIALDNAAHLQEHLKRTVNRVPNTAQLGHTQE